MGVVPFLLGTSALILIISLLLFGDKFSTDIAPENMGIYKIFMGLVFGPFSLGLVWMGLWAMAGTTEILATRDSLSSTQKLLGFHLQKFTLAIDISHLELSVMILMMMIFGV